MLVPIWMGTNMAAENQQKCLPLSFATKAQVYKNNVSLEELKKYTVLLFPMQYFFRWPNSPK